MRKRAAFTALFLAFLAYFAWNSAWHLPSQLVITGQAESPADVRVSWDSGSGFNDMEAADVVFGRAVDEDFKSSTVRIRRVGRSHPSSKSAEVWVKALQRSQDGHPMDLTAFTKQKGVDLAADGYLRLNADHVELQAPAGKKYTAFCFVAHEHAGFVEIDLDGDRRLYDLYAEQPQDKWIVRKRGIYAPGEFTVRVNLPRYDIGRLQMSSAEPIQTFWVRSVTIASEKGNIGLPLTGSGFRSAIGFDNFPRNTRQYFHPAHFLQQVLFALLSAWIAFSVFRFIRRRGGILPVLLDGQRPAFWLMFAGGVLAFGAWLLAYWPGHFTTDSVHIWWAARQPGYFMYDHPVMNVIFYRYLQQFWDYFAMVGIAQILLTSLLGAYFFFFLLQQGLKWYLIVPFYLLFVTSIPVGLYTISLWKDIPFALLTLFWAFLFVRLYLRSRSGPVHFSRGELAVMAATLLMLCLFRYNGVVYFLFVPLGLVALRVISLKRTWKAMTAVLLTAAVLVGLSIVLDKNRFILSQSDFFLKRMRNIPLSETASRVLRQYPHILDIHFYLTQPVWYDIWYRDENVTGWHLGFVQGKKYHEFIRYVSCEPKSEGLHSFLHQAMKKSYEDPWVYATWNPFFMLYLLLLALPYRLFPLTAAFGYLILAHIFVLLWVLGPYNYNWRYYYFAYLSLFFLWPLILLDIRSGRIYLCLARAGSFMKMPTKSKENRS